MIIIVNDYKIVSGCSINFFNINNNLEIENNFVQCGLCRKDYNFEDSIVYI